MLVLSVGFVVVMWFILNETLTHLFNWWLREWIEEDFGMFILFMYFIKSTLALITLFLIVNNAK